MAYFYTYLMTDTLDFRWPRQLMRQLGSFTFLGDSFDTVRPHPLICPSAQLVRPCPFVCPACPPLSAPVYSFACPPVRFFALVHSSARPPVRPLPPPSTSFHLWFFPYKLWRVEVKHALFVIAYLKTMVSTWRIHCMRPIAHEGT